MNYKSILDKLDSNQMYIFNKLSDKRIFDPKNEDIFNGLIHNILSNHIKINSHFRKKSYI